MGQAGFSMIEMVVATALTLTIAAVAVALVDPAQASFAVQPEAADMQQRLRVAAGTLHHDLVMAGAGSSRTPNPGPLRYYFAPVLPYRHGTSDDDPAGSFRTATMTVMYVRPTVAQTTIAGFVAAGDASANVGVNSDPGCPSGDALCGFRPGMSVLMYDASGNYDTFTITNTFANVLQVDRGGGSLTQSEYQPNVTTIVQLANIVYWLKSDTAAHTYQLMSNDGGNGADVPVVDHVVTLDFDYYGDPQPPALLTGASDSPARPRTTYGPAPPDADEEISTSGYPAGENCTFTIDPVTELQVPRLPGFLAGSETAPLVRLAGSELTDGPWCPDATNPNRWDADLLRIRKIGVTLRVQAANAALRGPASILFAHGGTSRSGNRWLPDLQVRFDVTPRNMELGR